MRKGCKRKVRDLKYFVDDLHDSDKPMKESQRVEILIEIHNAARSLTHGENQKRAWDLLASSMNISIILCEKAGNREVGLDVLYSAQNALIDAAERMMECGRLILSAGGQNAINEGVALYEQLLETVTYRQYTRACEEVLRRLDAKKAVQVRKGKRTERFAMKAA